MPYSEVSIVGYNANPPSDDGTAATQNEVAWDKHKEKLGDPLKTAVENTQTNITTVVNSIEADLIEAGTAMVFMQSAAPTGWTKDTTANLNDTALRLVTGTVSSRTANVDFSTCFGRTSTDGHSLTIAELAAHSHGDNFSLSNHNHTATRYANLIGVQSGSGAANMWQNTTNANTSSNSSSLSGSVNSTGSGSAHSHDIDLRVNYHDVIKATKD